MLTNNGKIFLQPQHIMLPDDDPYILCKKVFSSISLNSLSEGPATVIVQHTNDFNETAIMNMCIAIGSGTTPASINDFTLDTPICSICGTNTYDGPTPTGTSLIEAFFEPYPNQYADYDIDDVIYDNLTETLGAYFEITNISPSNISFTEIGLFIPIIDEINEDVYWTMITREVLDNPVTLEPNKSYEIHIGIR